MFFTYTLIATSGVIVLSPACLADAAADTMSPFFNKPYRLVSSDQNFDQVLKHLDIGWLRRKLFELAKPKLTLAWNPHTNVYSLTERSLLATIEIPFQIGCGFHENTVDGRGVYAMFTLHGTTLMETQKRPGKPTLFIERKFSPDHVHVKVQIDDVTSYRVYDAV